MEGFTVLRQRRRDLRRIYCALLTDLLNTIDPKQT
jgi:hypothetical protein